MDWSKEIHRLILQQRDHLELNITANAIILIALLLKMKGINTIISKKKINLQLKPLQQLKLILKVYILNKIKHVCKILLLLIIIYLMQEVIRI